MKEANLYPEAPDKSGSWHELSQSSREQDAPSASGLDWEANLGVK